MELKNNFIYRFFVGIFACSMLFSPITAHATADQLEAEMHAAYNKTIESNAWDNWPTGPSVYAESAIVMEADTGMILYAKDMEAKRYPASITKIMTALIALEQCELNEEVTYSYYATHSIEYGSSSIAAIGVTVSDAAEYSIPDNDFFLNAALPYINSGKDRFDRNHYEETNSTGPKTARTILETMDNLIKSVK